MMGALMGGLLAEYVGQADFIAWIANSPRLPSGIARIALKDRDLYFRVALVQALGSRDVPPIDLVLLALSDERYMVRATAVKFLGKTNDPGAVGPVVTMLVDKSPDVRRAAATALGILRDRRAVEPLVAAL